MPRTIASLVAAVAVALAITAAPAVAAGDPTSSVDPFVGTANQGNTFPGAALPFGMVQVSPDNGYYLGYDYGNSTIRGFSQTHLSGVGCGTEGDVPLMPTTGDLTSTDPGRWASHYDHAHESASPGSYSVDLQDYGIHADLTATTRTGWQRYTFPSTDKANVIVAAGETLGHRFGTDVHVVGDDTVQGSVDQGRFCANQGRYRVFFTAKFSRPFASFGTYKDEQFQPGSRDSTGANQRNGAYVRFDTTTDHTVIAKVALSYVSVDGATKNLQQEAPGWDFDAVRGAAHDTWQRQLSKIEVDGGSADQRTSFYTALYHALLHPSTYSDVDGGYRGADGDVHHTDRTEYANFSLWDTFRPQNQLVELVAPEREQDIADSILDIHAQGGWLPRWSLEASETNVMTGDPVTAFLSDAFSKGLLGDRTGEAYRALWQNVNEIPPADSPFLGRAGNPWYTKDGFVPLIPGFAGKAGGGDADPKFGASATLEYAASDCSLSTMASALGHDDDAAVLRQRAQNYRNIFDASTGFFRPRREDGSWWTPYSPTDSPGFHESGPWQYQWLVPQDPAGMVSLIGGATAASDRLDHFFAYEDLVKDPENTVRTEWISGPYAYYGADRYNPNNEPDTLAPWTYLWTGQPWKASQVVRAAQLLFTPDPSGITGNDDLGTMSSWYVLSALGLFPTMSAGGFSALDAPLFTQSTVHLAGGKTLTVSAPAARPGLQAIAGAQLNGLPWDRTYVDDSLLRDGGRLDLRLADAGPGDPAPAWGRTAASAPPSVCHNAPPQEHLMLGADPAELLAPAGQASDHAVSARITAMAPGNVAGTLTVQGDDGITATPASQPFTIHAHGTPAEQDVGVKVTVPASTPPGDHRITLTAVSDDGQRATAHVTVHVMRIGCTAADQACPVTLPYDHDGIATAAHPDDGSFDTGGWSYPAEELPPAGVSLLAGTPFDFPSGADGALNVVRASGQSVALPHLRAKALHVLGAAYNGSTPGTATVTYADGSTAAVPMSLSDWAGSPQYGEQVAVSASYRYKAGVGRDSPPVNIFARTIALDPSKEVTAITLPGDQRISLFAMTLEQAG